MMMDDGDGGLMMMIRHPRTPSSFLKMSSASQNFKTLMCLNIAKNEAKLHLIDDLLLLMYSH
jgi:hypothetical protein